MVVHGHELVLLSVNCSTSVHTERAQSDADVNTFPSFAFLPILQAVLIVWMVGLNTHGNRDLDPDCFYTNPQYTLLSRDTGALKGLSSSALSTEDWTQFFVYIPSPVPSSRATSDLNTVFQMAEVFLLYDAQFVMCSNSFTSNFYFW